MPKLKLPLIKGEETRFPVEAICPCCRDKKVFEPHSFAFIEVGALLADSRKDLRTRSPDMDAFFTMGWHGAYDEEAGRGKPPHAYLNVDIADAVKGGQFVLCFCSTRCLRSFLNACVDTLERRIQVETTLKKQKRPIKFDLHHQGRERSSDSTG